MDLSEEFVEKDPTGQYIRFDEILGKGAFKTVYKAFDEVNGIEVAWNQIDFEEAMQSPEQLQRLYSEVLLLKSLKHENIIKFYNSWVDDKNRTINMITELCTSGSLRKYRKKHNKVDMKAIKNWTRQILRGLHYLRSHNPPIIHRDLKCDNIFVNGNNGEVKIGDLGFAIVMQHPTARSVIGAPEFMAPELYEEEYNELVDIYSFGMCMLEMVTCEYPYSECTNPCQIYKKVTHGIKPASLGKVNDAQLKDFIEKCLVPASMRLPAVELLKDPFLASENSKELKSGPLQLPKLMLEPVHLPQPEPQSMDIDAKYKKLSVESFTRSINETRLLSTLEVNTLTGKNEVRLLGEKNDDNTISFSLHTADPSGRVKKINFQFFLNSDTALSIASEMIEELDLSNEDVAVVAELIDSLILKLIRSWKPSVEVSSWGANSLYGNSSVHQKGGVSIISDISAESVVSMCCSRGSNECDLYSNMFYDHVDPEIYSTDTDSCSDISKNSSFSSVGSLSLAERDKNNELKLKLDAINKEYQKRIRELEKMREEAIENAKRSCGL